MELLRALGADRRLSGERRLLRPAADDARVRPLVAFSLILFALVEAPADVTASFVVSEQVSVFLPFLIMGAAVGSQLSAIVNDTESRTEILARQAGDRLPRRWTFLLFLVPAILVVLLARRRLGRSAGLPSVRRLHLLQAVIAGRLAWRARRWGWVALVTGIGLAMAAVAVLGIPT